MAHLIDEITGAPAIAYVGETPWHDLGTRLQPGLGIDAWAKAAHLDWSVEASPAYYLVPGEATCRSVPSRKVLYRTDTQAALSTMSQDFHVVQPAQILELYAQMAKAGGFELETAGSLDGGRRIWALARVNDGAEVVNRDRVRPYVLLATAYDGSMATQAKFTAVRVVCHNTISMAVATRQADGTMSSGEYDEKAAGRQQVARVLHSTKWTDEVAEQVRLELGIVHNAYERFMVESRALANQMMSDVEADAFVAELLGPYSDMADIRKSKGFLKVIDLFKGSAKGSDLVGPTRWGMLNAVTEFVDHARGRSQALRLESAWFGTGNAIKTRAKAMLINDGKEAEKLAA